MKLIPLTQGQVAKVSDEWYEELNKDKWQALYAKNVGTYYAVRNPVFSDGKRKMILMHRTITNASNGMQVDHIDHDTLNNQIENLRICTPSQNRHNAGKQVDNTSGFKGVIASGKKWQAMIMSNGKRYCLGSYPTREEAARAYDEAAKKYHGDFAKLNLE